MCRKAGIFKLNYIFHFYCPYTLKLLPEKPSESPSGSFSYSTKSSGEGDFDESAEVGEARVGRATNH